MHGESVTALLAHREESFRKSYDEYSIILAWEMKPSNYGNFNLKDMNVPDITSCISEFGLEVSRSIYGLSTIEHEVPEYVLTYKV